jgi:hypothetical protein
VKSSRFKKVVLSTLPLLIGLAAHGERIIREVSPGRDITDGSGNASGFTDFEFFFTPEQQAKPVEYVELRLALAHSEFSSLRVSLISSTGKEVSLFEFTGPFDQAYMEDVVFKDSASTSIADYPNFPTPVRYTGTFRPHGEDRLSLFNGDLVGEKWTLRIEDAFEGGTGRVYAAGETADWNPVLGTALVIDAVPEPGTWLLLGLGSAGLAFMRRRKEA